MSDIVGTVVTVKQFLSKEEVRLTVNPNQPAEQLIVLPKNREYVIPAYQREIRWNSGNINVLLSDLLNGPRFLGNIILSLKQNNVCEIIDGQQRTTVLQMILACLKCKYHDEIELFEVSDINNNSFPGLKELIRYGFNESEISAERLETIKNEDEYSQYERIKALWGIINSSEILCDRYQASILVQNIKASEANIIASHSGSDDVCIKYFLDVNLKGVRLDKEDIFKGYLFGQDSREETRTLWQKNKKLDISFNELKGGKDNKRYPLMKLYEHYFYCDLYLPKDNGQDFSNISFGEDFCLTQTATLGSKKFYEGTHIIEVIQNSKYLQESLKAINRSLEIMINVASSDGPSDSFRALFKPEKGKKIDSIDIENTHCILQKILLDKEIIPKVLALKFIVSFFDGKTHRKDDYKSIYSVFAAATLFTVFANKKESGTFYSFVKETNWIERMNEWLDGYVHSHELTKGKVLAAYTFSDVDDSRVDQIRSKSLAAVFNYLHIQHDGESYKLVVDNCKQFNTFLTKKTLFSIEHFIIGESGTLKIKTNKYDFEYDYPPAVKRYRNSLFNYIFIPEGVNCSLENSVLPEKLEMINAQIEEVSCKYSKAYITLLVENDFFKDYPSSTTIDSYETKEEVIEQLNKYFSTSFPTDLLTFSSALIKSLEF